MIVSSRSCVAFGCGIGVLEGPANGVKIAGAMARERSFCGMRLVLMLR